MVAAGLVLHGVRAIDQGEAERPVPRNHAAGNVGDLMVAGQTGGGTPAGATMGGEITSTGTWVLRNAPGGAFRLDSTYGEWEVEGESHYMSFSFELESDATTVYGWAEIERIDKRNGRLLGWAYDDSGAFITAGEIPEPGALALLALGAAGVASWRRRKKT